jgi:uncharacterized protein (TIGR03067 family)
MEEQSKPVLDKGGKPVKGDVYTFKDGKVNSPLLKDADFSVDTSADPKLLNISSSPKEKWIGVYQLEGDTMTWCLISTGEIKDGALSVEQEGRRPRALDSKAGMLYVLKKKGAGGGDDTNKTEAAKLNGVWLIQSYEFNGNTNPEIVGGKYTFADDILTAVHPDFHKTPYSVVAGKDPMWIDITQRKMKYQGIYKLDGDTLQLCINEGKRPAKFDSKEGELFTLKREGKGKPPDEVKPKGGSGKLDGAWMIESAMKNGKSDDMAKGEAMEFENGKLTGSGPPVSFVLKEPNVIDLLISGGPGKTITLAGIYKLEGGKLHLCFPAGKDPSARPADFDAKDTSVAVLRRATKDDVRYSRAQSVTNLKLIGIAIHGHVDATKFLPPAASSGTTDGKPLLSWRVALLPYMKELDLYKQFDLNKAWDDPHNMKLVAKMPKVYAVSGIPAKEGMTHYRTIVGPGALLDPIKDGTGKLTTKYKLFSAPDGISNVIMVAEAKEAVIWTKPDELAYDPKGPLPKFGVVPAGFNVLVGDGAVFWVPATTPDRVLHPYMTCNNGMPREPLGGSKSDDGIKSKDFPPEKSKEPEELPRKEKPAVDKEAVNPRLEDAKREVAKAQLQVLTKAALAYAIRNNNKYPQSLAELLQKDETGAGPYLQDKRALVDPWNLLYQYDPTGPRNDGKRPDIWTVAPGKQVIGNWPVAQGK